MYHTIQFAAEFVAPPEIVAEQRRRRALIRKGDRLKAQVRPCVVETRRGAGGHGGNYLILLVEQPAAKTPAGRLP